LGGQFTSRINLNLREKHGYTYGAYSRFNYYKDNAFFYVSTSVSTENTSLAMSELFSELEGIRKGVTEEELIFAKSSITKKYPSNFETCGHLVSNLINKLLFNLPDDFFNSYIENINNVSFEDVNQAAIKNIHPKNSITILVGNRKELEKQLTSDGFGEVIFLNYDELFV
jgi:zinc protease